jgi:hypothetical protein
MELQVSGTRSFSRDNEAQIRRTIAQATVCSGE